MYFKVFKTLKLYYSNSNQVLMQQSPRCSNQYPLLSLKLCHFGKYHYRLIEKFSIFYKAIRVESLFVLFLFFFLWGGGLYAAPAAYENSQARDQTHATAATQATAVTTLIFNPRCYQRTPGQSHFQNCNINSDI